MDIEFYRKKRQTNRKRLSSKSYTKTTEKDALKIKKNK